MSGKKIVRVPYTVALEILAPIHLGPPKLTPELPGGTAVLSVHNNHECRCLDFTIQNPDFPETPAATNLPLHESGFIRPGALLMLRRDGEGLMTEPGRVAVLHRSSLRELGVIQTPGLAAGSCMFIAKRDAPAMGAEEIAELSRHVEQFDRAMVELRAAKKRNDAAAKEVKP